MTGTILGRSGKAGEDIGDDGDNIRDDGDDIGEVRKAGEDIGDDGDDMLSPTSPGPLARSRDIPVVPDEISPPKTSHLKSIAVTQLC